MILFLQRIDRVKCLISLLKTLLHFFKVFFLCLELLRMQKLKKVIYRTDHIYDSHTPHDNRSLADLISNLIIEKQLSDGPTNQWKI